MGISFVAGQMLNSNLTRDSNLAFGNNILYINYTDNRVGINTTGPSDTLEVVGNVTIGNVKISNVGIISANGNVTGNNLTANTAFLTGNIVIPAVGNIDAGYVNIGNVVDPVQSQDAATKGYVDGFISGGITIEDDTANTTPLALDGTLQLYGTADQVSAAITATDQVTFSLTNNISLIGNVAAGNNITANNSVFGNNITATNNIYANVLSSNIANITGNITVANLSLSANNIGTNNGNLVLFSGNIGVVLPVGNTAQRTSSVQGTLRFNSQTLQLEVYDGTNWVPASGEQSVITNQTLEGDGVTTTFTLNQATTAVAIIVTINGVQQTPDTAYTVASDQITFATAPAVGDVIQVRFIASTTTVTELSNSNGNTLVRVYNTPAIAFTISSSNAMVINSNSVVDTTGSQGVVLPGYTVLQTANLATPASGQMIFVTNGDAGNPCLAIYSGGAWKRVSLGATISAS